jgi:DNA-binding GntR family transcriptional regulator
MAALEALDREMKGPRNEDARLAYGQFAQSDGAFHDLIAIGSGNALIQETLSRLHIHVHLFRLYFTARATTDANKEHARIISAIKRHDANGAEAAMRDHIERSRERFMVIFTG